MEGAIDSHLRGIEQRLNGCFDGALVGHPGPHRQTTIHLVGCDFGRMRCRISSQIQTYDASTSCVGTSSGRIYRLVGPTRYDADAAEFYRDWLAKRGFTSAGHISDDFGRVLLELALSTWLRS